MTKPAVLLGAMLYALMGGLAPALAANEREYKIEAAFLYNFLNYITWPDYTSPEEMKKATICFQKGDPIEPYLHYMRYKMRSERKLTIRSIGEGASIAGCQLFFVREPLPKAKMQEAVRHQTLVVANWAGFVRQGGMIGLAMRENSMATAINHSLLKQEGFQVSSRLLSLAKEVR